MAFGVAAGPPVRGGRGHRRSASAGPRLYAGNLCSPMREQLESVRGSSSGAPAAAEAGDGGQGASANVGAAPWRSTVE